MPGCRPRRWVWPRRPGSQPEMRVLAPRAPWKWIACITLAFTARRRARCGAGAAARTGDRLRRGRGSSRCRTAPRRPAGGAGTESAHGPAPVRPDRGQPPRPTHRAERHRDADGAAQGHACASRRRGGCVAPTARASAAAVGRDAGRRQQRPVPAGRRRCGRTGRPACGDDAQRRRRPRGHPLAPHRSGGDACAGRDADAARRHMSGTAPATTPISACSRWPMRSSSRWTACP